MVFQFYLKENKAGNIICTCTVVPLVSINSRFKPHQTSGFQDFVVQEKEKCEGQNSYTQINFYFFKANCIHMITDFILLTC